MDIESLVEKIFSSLSLAQKCALLHGRTAMSFGGVSPELPEKFCADGPQGVRLEDGTKTTALPCGIALAATWDTALAEKYGAVIAQESKACGINVSLGPGMNLMRTPLCGRNFEYYGEDPVLAGKIAAGYVRGCQAHGVGATPKHLALNNQEICRTIGSSNCDKKTLRELYCEAFEIVIKEAQPWLIMNSYNRINGTFASEYTYTNQTFAKDECGFDGVMVTDWGGCHAAKEALYGGTDLEMGGDVSNWMNYPLAKELSCGKIFEDDLDDHVKRLIRLILRLAAAEKSPEKLEQLKQQHTPLAWKIACDAAVLLKNRDKKLPLDLSKPRNILICGPSADFRHNTGTHDMCGGSGACHPDHDTTVREAMQRKLGDKHNLRYAPAIRFADVQYLPEAWISACCCEYFTAGNPEPVFTENRSNALFSWLKGDTATLEKSGVPEDTFSFRITLTLTPDRDMELRLRQWRTRTVWIDSITFDGREIYTLPPRNNSLDFGSCAAQNVVKGGRYTVVIRGSRNGSRAGIFNLLCNDGNSENLQREALELAENWADEVIYVGGSNHRYDREGLGGNDPDCDIPDMEMCDGQGDFLRRLCQCSSHVTVALINGSAMVLEPWINDAAAVVEFWYPGQETGDVICDILTGAAAPQGRLPFTWGRQLGDYACHANGNYPGVRTGRTPHVNYDEGIFIGYRHFDRAKIVPQFPFGFGLSYTEFICRDVAVNASGTLEKKDIVLTVSGEVCNCGEHSGAEVLQLYLAYPADSPEKRPVKVLRNFVKIAVAPGECKRFEMKLFWRDLAFFDEKSDSFIAIPGEYKLLLARNAADIIAEFPAIAQ